MLSRSWFVGCDRKRSHVCFPSFALGSSEFLSLSSTRGFQNDFFYKHALLTIRRDEHMKLRLKHTLQRCCTFFLILRLTPNMNFHLCFERERRDFRKQAARSRMRKSACHKDRSSQTIHFRAEYGRIASFAKYDFLFPLGLRRRRHRPWRSKPASASRRFRACVLLSFHIHTPSNVSSRQDYSLADYFTSSLSAFTVIS